jgi:hypothetical protein
MSADPKEKLMRDAEWEDAVMDVQDAETTKYPLTKPVCCAQRFFGI